MAFQGSDPLGLLVWFLLLQTLLGEARMVPGILSLYPLPSEDGLDKLGTNPQERPVTGMPETSLAPKPGGSVVSLDSATFTPGHSFPTMTLSQETKSTWIPPPSGEVSGPWPSTEN